MGPVISSIVSHLVESVLSLLVEGPEVSGVHLDFEVFQPVSVEARDGFTGYVAALADAIAPAVEL